LDNKIAIYADSKKQKQIEDVLTKFLKKNDIPFKIHLVSDPEKFLGELLLKHDYRLFMVSEEGSIIYLLKIHNNFDRRTTCYDYGRLKFPLTQKELSNQILEVLKLSHTCPYDVYAAKNAKMYRLIQHADIEYIRRDKTKSVFYLQSGETMEVTDSLSRISAELDANYFIKCSKGYIVNFFNVERLSYDYKSLTMKSGAEIPMSRVGEKQFFKSLSFSIAGVNAFNY